MDVGGKKLKVMKASSGSTQVANFDVGITAISGLASQAAPEDNKGRVVQMLNMVTPDELMDDDEYEGKPDSPTVPLQVHPLTYHRNLRRHSRRMREIWQGAGAQGASTFRW